MLETQLPDKQVGVTKQTLQTIDSQIQFHHFNQPVILILNESGQERPLEPGHTTGHSVTSCHIAFFRARILIGVSFALRPCQHISRSTTINLVVQWRRAEAILDQRRQIQEIWSSRRRILRYRNMICTSFLKPCLLLFLVLSIWVSFLSVAFRSCFICLRTTFNFFFLSILLLFLISKKTPPAQKGLFPNLPVVILLQIQSVPDRLSVRLRSHISKCLSYRISQLGLTM